MTTINTIMAKMRQAKLSIVKCAYWNYKIEGYFNIN